MSIWTASILFTAMLFVLKLTHVIAWSWLVVFSPLILFFIIVVVIFGVFLGSVVAAS